MWKRFTVLQVYIVCLTYNKVQAEENKQQRHASLHHPDIPEVRWDTWSTWSPCSVDCGTGVMTRSRTCRSMLDGTMTDSCQGKGEEIRVCDISGCIREAEEIAACKKLETRLYAGKRYRWTPYKHPTHACEMACRPITGSFYLGLGRNVSDGTPCNENGGHVCIYGECKPLGCDDIVESGSQLDKCGVCSGKGDTCTTITKTYRDTAAYGYHKIATIPRGATKIFITEVEPSRNYLAIRGADGSFRINTMFRLSRFGDHPGAGTLFQYTKRASAKCPDECISADGPTDVDVELMILAYMNNRGIRYTYNVPKHQDVHASGSDKHNTMVYIDGGSIPDPGRGQSRGQGQGETGNKPPIFFSYDFKFKKKSRRHRNRGHSSAKHHGGHSDKTEDRIDVRVPGETEVALSKESNEEESSNIDTNINIKNDKSNSSRSNNSISSEPNTKTDVNVDGDTDAVSNGENVSLDEGVDTVTVVNNARTTTTEGEVGGDVEASIEATTVTETTTQPSAVKETTTQANTIKETTVETNAEEETTTTFLEVEEVTEVSTAEPTTVSDGVDEDEDDESEDVSEEEEDRFVDGSEESAENATKDDIIGEISQKNTTDSSEEIEEVEFVEEKDDNEFEVGLQLTDDDDDDDEEEEVKTDSEEENDSDIDIGDSDEVEDEGVEDKSTEDNLDMYNNDNQIPSLYSWRLAGYTQCSQTCGGGKQSPLVECIVTDKQAVVEGIFCSDLPKPLTAIRACNYDPCPPSWKPMSWSKCSVTCGKGTQTRDYTCVGSDGVEFRSYRCTAPKPPRQEQTCDMGSCTSGWYFAEWPTYCPARCGYGTISRRVHCASDSGNILTACPEREKPDTDKTCRNDDCGAFWLTGPWSKCNATCGMAYQTRSIACAQKQRDRITVVTDAACDADDKPASYMSCDLEPCLPVWFMNEWGECSVTCGDGQKSRDVRCLDNQMQPSDGCDPRLKPASQEPCSHRACPVADQYRPTRRPERRPQPKPDRESTQTSVVPDPKPLPTCKDFFSQCAMVLKARLCQYKYYANICCDTCSKRLRG